MPTRQLPSYSFLADQCKSMRQLMQIHAQMIISGRIQDNFAASRLLAFCSLSDSGDLNYASRLFSHLQQEPNLFMWNTLIRAHAGGGGPISNPQKSLDLYIDMRRFCITPGKHTFPFVLKACSSLKSLGTYLDLHVVNGLVRAYSVSAGLRDARKVFDESPHKNLSIWTTMISGYAQGDSGALAIELFHRMISQGFEPNAVTLSSVLSACAQSGGLSVGKQIHSYIKENNLELGALLGGRRKVGVDCMNNVSLVVSAADCGSEFKMKQKYNTDSWETHAYLLGTWGDGELVKLVLSSQTFDRGDSNSTTSWPVIDNLILKCQGNLLLPGGFDSGPAFANGMAGGSPASFRA
ncbi:OLC1v1011836C1 [Oldenlandia corymbosa var. corymbosa]|uniref:OLC1v1011836C1 n=1 Tax=Oldenlandia corymbosa var. corymbosa TaxID=529605 RepID=A0AAV1DUR7_OLDCO|nr:OLC1v1011836C1 [Oldenlandia corymbosa var. corymbosa]